MTLVNKKFNLSLFLLLIFVDANALATSKSTSSVLAQLSPYTTQILTTIGLLLHEIFQPAASPFATPIPKYTINNTAPIPPLTPEVQKAIETSKTPIVMANMDGEGFTDGTTIFLHTHWTPTESTETTSAAVQLIKNSYSFIVAHELAHIKHNDVNKGKIANIAIIAAVPFVLHAYGKLSDKAFNILLGKLDPAGTTHYLVNKTHKIHQDIVVKNPLIQAMLTFKAQEWCSKLIEREADREAIKITKAPTFFFDYLKLVESEYASESPNTTKNSWLDFLSQLFPTHDSHEDRNRFTEKVFKDLKSTFQA